METPPPPLPNTILPPPEFIKAHPTSSWRRIVAWVLIALIVVIAAVFAYEKFGTALPHSVSYGVENLGTPGTLRIVETTYPSVSPVITKFVVTQAPYNADATGATDATAAFQAAIKDAFDNGGGAVFVPDGTYRFDGTLTLPEGVTLRGDWKEPSARDKKVGGAVLAIYNSKDTFITLDGGAGVDGLNFWYPNQDVKNVEPYPATIGVATDGFTPDRDAMSVQNVDFVNAYIGTDWSFHKAVQSVHVHNVYGTPLAKGAYLLNVAQTSRLDTVNFSPLYWSQSGLVGAPSDADAAAYTETHSTGLAFGPGGGSYDMDITVDKYSIGVSDDDSDSNDDGLNITPILFGVTVTNANHALYINSKGGDLHVTAATLEANQGDSPAAVYIDPKTVSDGFLYLDEGVLTSTGDALSNTSSSYNLNVMHSTFSSWNGYAVRSDQSAASTILVEGSTFASAAKDFHLGTGITQAVIMGNTVAGGATAPSIDGNSAAAQVNTNALSIPSTGVSGFQSIGFDGTGLATMIPDESAYVPAKTDVGSLFVVTDYGAKGNCSGDTALDMNACTTDDTAAVQKAIDAAKAHGGGTVYFPASTAAPGKRTVYLIKGTLSVPSGVELTGPALNTSTYIDNAQTALVVEPTAGSATPVITLAANSGMRGLVIWQANLDAYANTPFPYLIQSQGENVYLINVTVANAYDGVDMGSYDSTGHFVNKLQGYAVNNLLRVSKSAHGYIGDYQFDPGPWGSADGRNATNAVVMSLPISPKNPPQDSGAACANGTGTCTFDINIDGPADVYAKGVSIILGSAKNELMTSVFSHAPKIGIQTVADGGSGPSFTLVNFGAEIYTAFDFEALDPKGAEIVSSVWHTLIQHGTGPKDGDPNGVYGYAGCKTRGNGPNTTPCNDEPGQPYIIAGSGVAPTTPIRIFTMDNQQYTKIGWQVAGGKIIAQQYDTGDRGTALEEFAKVTGGASVSIIGGDFLFPFPAPQLLFSLDATSHAALAGTITQGPVQNTGAVDTTFQPAPSSVPQKGGGKKKAK